MMRTDITARSQKHVKTWPCSWMMVAKKNCGTESYSKFLDSTVRLHIYWIGTLHHNTFNWLDIWNITTTLIWRLNACSVIMQDWTNISSQKKNTYYKLYDNSFPKSLQGGFQSYCWTCPRSHPPFAQFAWRRAPPSCGCRGWEMPSWPGVAGRTGRKKASIFLGLLKIGCPKKTINYHHFPLKKAIYG